ncbi:MAG: peptidase m23, partial [Parcubacteria group bacterium Gr01-1014_33]
QERIKRSLAALRIVREDLLAKKANAEEKKEELENLSVSLKDKKGIQEGIQKNKAEILAATKNEEKKYQELLRDREKQRQSLENEVAQIEEKIRVTIDPSTLPSKRHGILGSPLPEIARVSCREQGAGEKNCVTQFFGRTDFANAGGYNGKGHNGADFRAEIGTPVFAAEDGIIETTGDTDAGCRGASYGKWILIRHSNNLSTLYGHLSAIGVAPGETIPRGDKIGYSGKTGYATGPHLHFTVFVTKAVEIKTIISKVCGRAMTLPVAGSDPISGIEGYLDPLDYL